MRICKEELETPPGSPVPGLSALGEAVPLFPASFMQLGVHGAVINDYIYHRAVVLLGRGSRGLPGDPVVTPIHHPAVHSLPSQCDGGERTGKEVKTTG